MRRTRHPLIETLTSLRGNGRACVYTEPMWGLSMALVLPYASVYMLALGLNDKQIGLLATISMLSQMVSGLLSGAITDKLGRRLTTAVSDLIAFVIPGLVWAFAQNFWWFLVAAAVNGVWQVSQNSWDCLLVEDIPRSTITRVYSLVKVAADLSALFAPIAALVGLAVVAGHLGRLRGRTGQSLPRWVPVLLQVVTILQAATVYTQAFVVPYLAGAAPHLLDDEAIGLFAVSMMVIWSTFSLTFVVVAVVGATRRVVPVVGAVAIALGALSMPMFGPAGALVIGAGLAYWALTRAGRATDGSTADAAAGRQVGAELVTPA